MFKFRVSEPVQEFGRGSGWVRSFIRTEEEGKWEQSDQGWGGMMIMMDGRMDVCIHACMHACI